VFGNLFGKPKAAAPQDGVQPPSTYAEWSACIDLFESGLDDAGALAAMQAGTLTWTSGVAERFSERMANTFNKRLSTCADRMTRELGTGADEVTLVRALTDARRTLCLLHTAATLPIFPPTLQNHLTGSVKNYAERSQQSLEESAKHDRSGRTASIIRNNSILHYENATASVAPAGTWPHVSSAVPASQPADGVPGVRRRNILT
jgi:hypothetical protein